MSYYNTNQNQNTQQQQSQGTSSTNNQPITGGGLTYTGTGSTSTQNQQKPVKYNQPVNTTTPHQTAQGWTPSSPVNSNGTLSKQPIVPAQNNQMRAPMPQMPASTTGMNLQSAQDLVNQTYQNLFGRAPRTDELQAWTAGMLYGGRTPQDMYTQLAGSEHARQEFNPLAVPGNVQYNAQNFGNVNIPDLYNISRPSSYQFDPNNIGQYAAQNNQYANDIQGMWAALNNLPLGLPVEQMKAAQAETANELAKQSGRIGMESMASRGIVGGGQAEAMRQLIDAQKQKDILGSYRDIDIADAEAQRTNAMAMLGLGDQLATSSQGRTIQDYLTQLQGQNTAEGYRQQAANSAQTADMAFQDYLSRQFGDDLSRSQLHQQLLESQAKDNQFGASYDQQTWGMLQDAFNKQRSQNLQDYVAQSGMNLDIDQFAQDKAQDRFGNILDILGFLENQRQFNVGSDLDRSQLDLSKNNSALQAAISGRGQDIDLLNLLLRSGGG